MYVIVFVYKTKSFSDKWGGNYILNFMDDTHLFVKFKATFR